MSHIIHSRGDDCLIIYHPSAGTIARARIRRALLYRLAQLRAFIISFV